MNKGLPMFKAVAGNPAAYIRTAKADTGRKVVGYFCSYTPEELIFAAGAIPYRIFGTSRDIKLADAHLQSYCCALVRSGLEDALRGELDFLDGTVFPHTCDSIQRLSDIWRLNAGFPFHIDVVMPVKLNTDSARMYMIDVMKGFKKELESALNTEISDASLRQALDDYNRIRRQLARLYEIRSRAPHALPPNAIHDVMKAAMVMDRKVFLDAVSQYVESIASSPAIDSVTGRKRILLSGGICNHPDIYGLLSEAGGDVVWDDLCTGNRFTAGQMDLQADPIEALADRYLTRMVCPAKHADNTTRGEALVESVREQNAAGVIFMLLKFCDPHAFDYPYLKKYLDDAGIPSLLFEVEEQPPSEGQLRTRFETFVDML